MNASCTLKDIAKELGVTPSTVSRVLNDSPVAKMVSDSMRAKIKDAAERLGYVPNVNARRLVNSKSGLIGIVLPADDVSSATAVLADRALADTMGGMETVFKVHGYRMLLIFNDANFAARREHLSLFRAKSVDGMIIWGARDGESFWDELSGFNAVMISSRNSKKSGLPFIGSDNFAAGRGLTKRLLAAGRRKIAYLDNYGKISISAERFAGYKKALADAKIPFDERICFRQNYSLEENLARLLELKKAEPSAFDAVQCINDGVALSCGLALRKAGLDVPRDAMLAGGDRIEDRYGPMIHWQVPLVSFRPQCFEIGRLAAQLVADGAAAKKRPADVLLPVEFVD